MILDVEHRIFYVIPSVVMLIVMVTFGPKVVIIPLGISFNMFHKNPVLLYKPFYNRFMNMGTLI